MTELLEAGVHYGHQTKRWNPKMRDFIFEEKNSIYIIDLSKTVEQIHVAQNYLGTLVRGGGKALFVGCKKQAQDAVREAAEASNQFYVNDRWLGGTLTNLTTIRRSVARMNYIEQLLESTQAAKMNKKEVAMLRRELHKLHRNLSGIRNMERLPDAIIVIDTLRESLAIQEARRLKIPVVAIVDTNSNPDVVDYPIAGNDDAIRSIRVILQKIVDAIVEGEHQVTKQSDAELSAVAE